VRDHGLVAQAHGWPPFGLRRSTPLRVLILAPSIIAPGSAFTAVSIHRERNYLTRGFNMRLVAFSDDIMAW
jgi:hypothetical protein